jgi:uncharacterized phosphosugar-binding protein
MTDATSRPKPSELPSQSGPPDAMSQYFQAVRQALGAIEMTQVPVIRQAAERFAATILTGRLVHVFGTGHSRMAVEEMFPRYGSFPGFHPIVELSMSYHNHVVGANGQRQAMFLENVQGFGPVLWRNFAVTHDDALLAISSSGCNAVTIDVAIEARFQGMFVVAPTSQANAAASTSRHQSARKLQEVADLVLDQQAPPGDSAVWIKDLQTSVAPLSSITKLHDHQPDQGRGRPPADRGRSPPPRSSPPPAIWAPIAPGSFSRKPTTTTTAAWECSIAEGHLPIEPGSNSFTSGCMV